MPEIDDGVVCSECETPLIIKRGKKYGQIMVEPCENCINKTKEGERKCQ